MNMLDRKLKDGVDGFLLYKKFSANINSGMGRLAINTTAENIQHRVISSSIHYIYLPSSMSSQGQCTVISARSSVVASVNAPSFICLQSATASPQSWVGTQPSGPRPGMFCHTPKPCLLFSVLQSALSFRVRPQR